MALIDVHLHPCKQISTSVFNVVENSKDIIHLIHTFIRI